MTAVEQKPPNEERLTELIRAFHYSMIQLTGMGVISVTIGRSDGEGWDSSIMIPGDLDIEKQLVFARITSALASQLTSELKSRIQSEERPN